uniref:Calcium-activated chloride channel N-terminal domain-containing protein n=1 Tax=Molossus molossus TaxID=27622 RepID=A0A7J8F978_MOLMO|nr:hypothetical protein HJG59_008528 [Molossus molossus]
MVLSLTVILFLVLHLLPGVKTSMVNLNNNGYDGIVIAINSSVPEDEKLIQNTKEMVTEASTYLFHATKGRIYIRNVSILIPVTWKSKSEYLMSKQESYDQVTEFTATGTHSTEAPTPQNKMGSHRSTWDIIRESYDFQNVAPMTGTNPPPHPTFSLLKAKNQVVCLVLDKSGSMASAIIQSNQRTSGSEIMLLTDGEDDEISSCFEEVKPSGAIIHTIALGPSAAKELETLSNMTGDVSENSAPYDVRNFVAYIFF